MNKRDLFKYFVLLILKLIVNDLSRVGLNVGKIKEKIEY